MNQLLQNKVSDHYQNRSVGRLHYSPKLLGQGSKWWMVLWCDQEIVKYHRHLFFLDNHKCQNLQSPAWDAHITVIRDEEPSEDYQHLWRLRQDQICTFEYNFEAETNGDYWWLTVYSDQLLDIREELGLKRNPEYPLHLSFGKA